MNDPKRLFAQTSSSVVPESELGFDPLNSEVEIPDSREEISSLTTRQNEIIMQTIRDSEAALGRVRNKKIIDPGHSITPVEPETEVSPTALTPATNLPPSDIQPDSRAATPEASQVRSVALPILPEPYPGAGKGVSEQFWVNWPVLKAKLDKLPLMSLATLKNLGPKELETDHGKVVLPPYLQLTARFAASYYGESLPEVHSDLAMKVIASCYKAIKEKALSSEDVEVINFAGTIKAKKLGHWVKLVGMIMFDDQVLANPSTIENFTRDDFRAATEQLTGLYPDARAVLMALANLVMHGEEVIEPVEDFLVNQDDVGKFLNTHCKGTLSGFDMAVRIESRVVSSSASYESARSNVESESERPHDETVSQIQAPRTGEGDAGTDRRSQNLRINTRSGSIDLEAEYGGDDEGRKRDTSKFLQNLELANVKERLEAIEKNQAEMNGMIKGIGDKLEISSKKHEKAESQMTLVLQDICESLKSLIAQRSLAELKNTTAALNSTFFAKSDDEDDSYSYVINPSKDLKGKGKIGSSSTDLVTRLLEFKKEDCKAIVADLKRMFNNAGQPAMATAITEAMLMKDHTRINMANNVKKFQNFL